MHELRSPLDSLYDLRGEIELTFDAWTGRGSFRVRQDGVGRLSADVWFPRGEALGRLGSVAQIRGVTARLDDGRRVGFTPACPLVSRSQIATDHLRLTLRPSRILIGPYPRGVFVLRSYLTNVSTRGGGIETTVPGIGTIWHRAAPNTRQLQDNWLPTATPDGSRLFGVQRAFSTVISPCAAPPHWLSAAVESCLRSLGRARRARDDRSVRPGPAPYRLGRATSRSHADRTPFASPPLMRVQRVAEPPSAGRRQPGRASPGCCAGASCCTRSASPRAAPAPRAGCRTARRPGTRRAAGR